MPGGNAVKIGIVVVALTVAVVVFAVSSKKESAKSYETKTMKDLVCTKCNAHFEMPIADYEKAYAAAPKRENVAPGVARARHMAELPRLLKCAKCGEETALPAAKCQNSDTWYPIKNPDGTTGKCPD
jgi:hypothetical protein